MIWHDTIRKYPHRNLLTSQPNQLHKGSVITVLMEYLDLCVTSIDDVIADVAYRGSGCAWHAAIYLGPYSLGKRKEECPLFYLAARRWDWRQEPGSRTGRHFACFCGRALANLESPDRSNGRKSSGNRRDEQPSHRRRAGSAD